MAIDPDTLRMRTAYQQAARAYEAGEVPVGAVIYRGNELIAKAHNQVELLQDPTAHAEILAITQATQALENWRLEGCTLYVTKEPCPMCAGALVLARVDKVVWGVDDPRRGGAISRFQILSDPELNHRAEIERGVMLEECRDLLLSFFRARRKGTGPEKPGPPEGGPRG